MAEKFIVKEQSKLLEFLFLSLNTWPKKKVKQRLQNSSIRVNEKTVTKHDFILNVNDKVEIGILSKNSPSTVQKLEILYQDKDIVVINKPAGLLSVSTPKETKQHALNILRLQISKKREQISLWPVHRLDRDTSGILVFATSKEKREAVMDKWKESTKTYLAIVKGLPKNKKATINEPLRLDEKLYKMHVGKHKDAKEAITHYEVIQEKKQNALLKVQLETGRQHQIRAHLSFIGNSVIGDERYGIKGDRMGLHACELSIFHPVNNKKMTFKVDAPKEFYDLLV